MLDLVSSRARRRRMSGTLVILAASAVVSFAFAPATSAKVFPGLGVGPVKVGQSKATIRREIGKPDLARTKGGQLSWYYTTGAVGYITFNKHGIAWSVLTSEKGQKTNRGVGVGSTVKAVKRAYRSVICSRRYKVCVMYAGRKRTTGFTYDAHQKVTAVVVQDLALDF